jgi:hypothetical protein
MKRSIRNLGILVLPFLLMIIVNETVRLRTTNDPYSQLGIIAINSADRNLDNCTWICHNDTGFCKQNHVTYLDSYFQYTDPIYFGAINLLKSTGNYGLTNIVFLVVLVPLMIWFFLIKSLNIQSEISKLKKHNEEFN